MKILRGLCVFLTQLITDLWFFGSLQPKMIQNEWTYRKTYRIIYHKQERSRGFFLTIFNVYQVIHILYEHNEPLKLSLSLFCGNEYLKHVIGGKIDMKPSD